MLQPLCLATSCTGGWRSAHAGRKTHPPSALPGNTPLVPVRSGWLALGWVVAASWRLTLLHQRSLQRRGRRLATVGFGIGREKDPHTVDESIAIADLLAAAQGYQVESQGTAIQKGPRPGRNLPRSISAGLSRLARLDRNRQSGWRYLGAAQPALPPLHHQNRAWLQPGASVVFFPARCPCAGWCS